MHDYFGALLRSAGSSAMPAQPSAPTLADSAGQAIAAADDGREEALEVDALPPTGAARSPSPPRTPASAEPVEPDDGQAVRAPRPGDKDAAAPTRPSMAALDGALHPAVQAALRWVRSGPAPERMPADAAEPAVQQPQAHSAPNQGEPMPEAPSRSTAQHARAAAPADRPVHASLRAAARPSRPEPMIASRAIGVLPLELEAADDHAPRRPRGVPPPGRPADTFDAPAAPRARDPVQVTIGTIRVQVDAPPAPRATALPPAPAAPAHTPAARAAEAGGFARARLPRL